MAVSKDKKTRKYLFFAILFLVSLFLVFVNIDIYKQRMEIKGHLTETKERLEDLTDQRELIKKREEDRDVEDYVERVAREQLLFVKEGESVIVISREEEDDYSEEDTKEEKEEEELVEEEGFFEKLFK